VTTTPDWLKEDPSPFSDEDIFSSESSSSPDAQQPDWLQDAPVAPVSGPDNLKIEKDESSAESTVVSSEVVVNTESSPVADIETIPDWLRDSTATSTETITDALTPQSLSF
jgi:hypothetical protein